MLKLRKLNECIDVDSIIASDSSHMGIFGALYTLYTEAPEWLVPWSLDMDYHLNRSGEKYLAPMPSILVSQHDGTAYEGKLVSGDLVKIATVIKDKYGDNWDKAYSAYMAEYNPIENYNMVASVWEPLPWSMAFGRWLCVPSPSLLGPPFLICEL